MESYGLAMRDGVYETFMEYAKVTDLQELKNEGYSVKEIPLFPKTQWDKLLILVKDKKILCGCIITVDWEKLEPEVEFLEGLQAKEALRRLTTG